MFDMRFTFYFPYHVKFKDRIFCAKKRFVQMTGVFVTFSDTGILKGINSRKFVLIKYIDFALFQLASNSGIFTKTLSQRMIINSGIKTPYDAYFAHSF